MTTRFIPILDARNRRRVATVGFVDVLTGECNLAGRLTVILHECPCRKG